MTTVYVPEIAATDYQGWVTVELYPYIDDPDGAGREARDFLAGIGRWRRERE